MLTRQWLRWAAVVAWMGLIFFLSAQPQLPSLTPGLPSLQEVGGHIIFYFVLASLWSWALGGAGVRHACWWALAIAALYGISDEFHQSFVPHRDPSLFDWRNDVMGAGAAALLAWWYTSRFSPRPR
jgi:VanZ family protein